MSEADELLREVSAQMEQELIARREAELAYVKEQVRLIKKRIRWDRAEIFATISFVLSVVAYMALALTCPWVGSSWTSVCIAVALQVGAAAVSFCLGYFWPFHTDKGS